GDAGRVTADDFRLCRDIVLQQRRKHINRERRYKGTLPWINECYFFLRIVRLWLVILWRRLGIVPLRLSVLRLGLPRLEVGSPQLGHEFIVIAPQPVGVRLSGEVEDRTGADAVRWRTRIALPTFAGGCCVVLAGFLRPVIKDCKTFFVAA